MRLENIESIAVIGAGVIGPQIAPVFAMAGYRVNLMDLKHEALEKALGNLKSYLEFFAEENVINVSESEDALRRVKTTTSLKEAVQHADFIVEAVTENLPLKQRVFKEMDELAPEEAILASNTSSFMIGDIASSIKRVDKAVGTHWINPAYLSPLVEIVRSKDTSDETVKVTEALIAKVGKTPVVLRDSPGFIVDRVLHLVTNASCHLLEEGVASAEDIDKAVGLSFGYSLPFMGPLQTQDFVGLDVSLAAREYESKHLGPCYEPPEILRRRVAEGRLGVKTGIGHYDYAGKNVKAIIRERDRNLIGLLRLMGYFKKP